MLISTVMAQNVCMMIIISSSFFKVSCFSYFRRNPFDPEVLHINDSSSLHNSHFDFDNKVKILAHGWLNHGYSPMPESIKEGKSLFSTNM